MTLAFDPSKQNGHPNFDVFVPATDHRRGDPKAVLLFELHDQERVTFDVINPFDARQSPRVEDHEGVDNTSATYLRGLNSVGPAVWTRRPRGLKVPFAIPASVDEELVLEKPFEHRKIIAIDPGIGKTLEHFGNIGIWHVLPLSEHGQRAVS